MNAEATQTDPRLQGWIAEAHKLGVEAARNAASWITDGNDTDDSRRRKLEIIEADGPYDILNPPNLSGEWADDATPRYLFETITGLDAHAESTWNHNVFIGVVDMLCDAYEDGVLETFEDACIAELQRWIGEES